MPVEALFVELRRELMRRDLRIMKLERVKVRARELLVQVRRGNLDAAAMARLEDALYDVEIRLLGEGG